MLKKIIYRTFKKHNMKNNNDGNELIIIYSGINWSGQNKVTSKISPGVKLVWTK
jgi:hypothetical protein